MKFSISGGGRWPASASPHASACPAAPPGTFKVFENRDFNCGGGGMAESFGIAEYDGKLLYFCKLLYRPDGVVVGRYLEISLSTGRSTTYIYTFLVYNFQFIVSSRILTYRQIVRIIRINVSVMMMMSSWLVIVWATWLCRRWLIRIGQ